MKPSWPLVFSFSGPATKGDVYLPNAKRSSAKHSGANSIDAKNSH